ncbi:MAG: dihydrofolate reductase [Actinophytocola sp.]|uniref:dihydrofolate reductase family protein n=1 Tax=Actinophytocola sp. TaxID=1872138 RepID=UPI001325CC9F|nr:dihydrofolate reductase family protein [Actinophytocola sp.]MPZ84247.1 dihydrofolate reductase [Actinophytocola sp.]
MGRLTYSMAVSLDGYIADATGDIDWGDPSEELHRFHNEQLRSNEVSLYGRKLWEAMSGHWPTGDERPGATPVEVDFAGIWRAQPKVVFSSGLAPDLGWNARLFRGDPVPEIARLRSETDGDLDIGGATLAGAAMRAGLVDEYRLFVSPILVGGGTPYFSLLDGWVNLRLAQTRHFPADVVMLRYETRR